MEDVMISYVFVNVTNAFNNKLGIRVRNRLEDDKKKKIPHEWKIFISLGREIGKKMIIFLILTLKSYEKIKICRGFSFFFFYIAEWKPEIEESRAVGYGMLSPQPL